MVGKLCPSVIKSQIKKYRYCPDSYQGKADLTMTNLLLISQIKVVLYFVVVAVINCSFAAKKLSALGNNNLYFI